MPYFKNAIIILYPGFELGCQDSLLSASTVILEMANVVGSCDPAEAGPKRQLQRFISV
jgi:hypothetical protein